MSWDLGYYWQSVSGHWSMIRAAQPLDRLLDDPALDPVLRERLERAQRIRRFASEALGLPDNGSFTRYADLKRPFVVWNVVAAPRYSLELQRWCFPVAGCITYRGYYDKDRAEAFARTLEAQGLDVYVAGVPAYSTLGWFDDPLLNTFIGYGEPELARLIFHELAHQLVYVSGDSTFNESFATAVEQIGVSRWLASRGDPSLVRAYRQHEQRRQAFVALLTQARDRLMRGYAQAADDTQRQRIKDEVFAALQRDYQSLKAGWGGWAGYDRWFGQKLGNAHLGSVATYTALVPGFLALAEQQPDLPAFYDRVREIAKLDKNQRDQRLAAP
ncbi:MAG: aminopeptidase [Burkholderiaceae bacterium]